jgi:DNA polymerase-3 subunit epsilon
MQLIHECLFTAIDFESAGAAPGMTDQPVQVGLASWSALTGHHNPFVSYLHTDQPIQWSAQKIHGIKPADLTHAPTLLSLWPELNSRLNHAVVVAHGKGTEKRFLRTFPGHGFSPWIDTLLLARAAWPHLKSHTLSSLCQTHQLTPTIQALVPHKSWHDALFDSVASLVLLEFLIQHLNLLQTNIHCLLSPDTSTWHRNKHSR